MAKKISIIGCGWLGLPCAKAFLAKGFKVKGSTRSEAKRQELKAIGIDAHLFDLSDQNKNLAALLDTDILLINIPNKNIPAFEELQQNILQSKVKKVIFVSSTSVYQNNNDWVAEDSALEENHPLVKIEALFKNAPQLDCTIVRFAGLIGGKRNPANFFANRAIPQPKAATNMIFQDDAVNCIVQIVEQGAWNQVFNACGNEHPEKITYYTQARAFKGWEAPEVAENPKEDYKIVSNQKIKNHLGIDFLNITDFKSMFGE